MFLIICYIHNVLVMIVYLIGYCKIGYYKIYNLNLLHLNMILYLLHFLIH